MAERRTYRVKAGYGPHGIVDESGMRCKVRAGETFRAYGHEPFVRKWAYKLEEVVGGAAEPVSTEPTELEDAADAAHESVNPEMVHTGGGWYDVINPVTGVKLNSRSLRKSAAEKFLTGGSSKSEPAQEQAEGEEEPSDADKSRRRRS